MDAQAAEIPLPVQAGKVRRAQTHTRATTTQQHTLSSQLTIYSQNLSGAKSKIKKTKRCPGYGILRLDVCPRNLAHK